ncbi:MAG: hypothetical protein KDB23_18310 [Planctomycetales bacterium]|nr:hypothetical protein [Planctomycetales bacterium]
MSPPIADLTLVGATESVVAALHRLRGVRCRLWQDAGEPGDALVVWSPLAECAASFIPSADNEVLLIGPANHLSATQVNEWGAQADGRVFLLSGSRGRPYYRAAWQSVASNQLGQPGLVRYHLWHDEPDLSLEDGLDVVISLMNDTPIDVFATTCSSDSLTAEATLLAASAPTDEQVIVQLGFAQGGMAVLNWHRHSRFRDAAYESLHVIGATGAFYGDDHDNVQLMYHDGVQALPAISPDDVLREQLQAWVDEEHGLQSCQTAPNVLRTPVDEILLRRLAGVARESCQRGAVARLLDGEGLTYEF